MSKAKKMWVRTMDLVMLNCDTATLLITRSEFEKLSCTDQIKLKMHLAGCKFCRRFKKQSEFISYALRHTPTFRENDLPLRLNDQQKQKMKEKMGI